MSFGRVVGIGAVVLDRILVLPEFPSEDTKATVSSGFSSGPTLGGPSVVKLAYLQHFGWSTEFLGSCGDDAEGRALLRQLAGFGIGFDELVMQVGRRSASAQVWLSAEDGTRTVAFDPGTLDLLPPDGLYLKALLKGASELLIDMQQPELALVATRVANALGVPVFLDSGSYQPVFDELLPLVDVAQVPVQLARKLFDTDDLALAARLLRERGAKRVVVTDGERGCAYSTPEGSGTVPAFRIHAVDSLGAGDVFGAGLTYAVLRGWPFEECVRFASATAALKCTHWGKTDIPTEDDIKQFMTEHGQSLQPCGS